MSGGRGEYELSGEAAGGVRAADLIGLRIFLDLGGGWVVDTDTRAVKQGGKPRLRRFHRRPAYIQVQLQLAAALLMPHPIRYDHGLAGGLPILRAGRYAIEQIEVANEVKISEGSVFFVVEEVVLRNLSNHAEDLHFRERRDRVLEVWSRAAELPGPIYLLLDKHRELVRSGGPIMAVAEDVVVELSAKITEFVDDLGILFRSTDSDILNDLTMALKLSAEPPPESLVLPGDIDPDETQLKRRAVKAWKRWANARGAASARFRQQVREAYRSTCVVCGIHLPSTTMNAVPGVDAAHILPWADYDLDVVANGICLCKLHHWAFDEGLILILEDRGIYSIEVPEEVEEALGRNYPNFSLAQFAQYAGPIPEQRLPRNPHLRPNPLFLQRLAQA